MAERIVIDCWDWHYKVAFDHSLALKIREHANRLNSHLEQSLLTQQLEAYSSIVSIAALCDAIEESPHRAKDFLAEIDGRALLHVPPPLEPVLLDRIVSLPGISDSDRGEIRALVSSALKTRFRNCHVALFEPVFGKSLQELTSRFLSEVPEVPLGRLIDHAELQATVDSILRRLLAPECRLSILGQTPAPSFDVILKPGVGFAEYWPSELVGSKRDQLIVFDNPDHLRESVLHATLTHEVLGHGVFYSMQVQFAPPFFDHGAMSLIEGWATWCEWHASNKQFGAFSRNGRLLSLRWFYEEDPSRICQHLSQEALALGYSSAAATSSILQYFQYPGFSSAYTLGALWFEDKFREITPARFFESIGARPWGDFFLTW